LGGNEEGYNYWQESVSNSERGEEEKREKAVLQVRRCAQEARRKKRLQNHKKHRQQKRATVRAAAVATTSTTTTTSDSTDMQEDVEGLSPQEEEVGVEEGTTEDDGGDDQGKDESKGEGDECAICLEVLEPGGPDIVVLACNHRFHGINCGEKWLASCRFNSREPTCPMCRKSFVLHD